MLNGIAGIDMNATDTAKFFTDLATFAYKALNPVMGVLEALSALNKLMGGSGSGQKDIPLTDEEKKINMLASVKGYDDESNDVIITYNRTKKTPKGGRSGGGSVTQQTEEQLNTQKIQQLSRDYEKSSEERREAIKAEIKVLQQRNAEIKAWQEIALGQRDKLPGTWTDLTQSDIKGVRDIGLNTQSIQEQLNKPIDVSAIKTPLQSLEDELKRIIELQALAWSPEQFAAYQERIDTIREKIGNFKGVSKTGKEAKDSWKDAAQAIQSVGSAMTQIEDPAAKVVGTIAQAIATIALAYAQASANAAANPANAGWGWIAFAAAGLTTMLSSISAIHSATGYAQGGIVQGNSFSGDNILAPIDGGASGFAGLNAGEIVLNKAAQGNLASQLQGRDWGGMHIVGEIQGTKILLVANRTLKAQNKGELVYWKG